LANQVGPVGRRACLAQAALAGDGKEQHQRALSGASVNCSSRTRLSSPPVSGLTHVIDYTAQDFTQNGQRYDVIMDTVGNAPYARVKNSLKPGGRLLMVVGDLFQTVASTWQRATIGSTSKVSGEIYRTLMSPLSKVC
jgi:hypothetical protein